MKELLRISQHQPVEVVTVRDDKVEELLATRKYRYPTKEAIRHVEEDFKPSENIHEKEDVFFSEKLTEKEIKAKIEKYKIPIDYDIKRDTKKETLLKLKGLGYNAIWQS